MMPKLLLADDSITVQRVIALTFQGEGIEVIAVGDGDSAVDAIDRERPQIVLADLSMPGRDGYAVAEYVKRSPELARDIRVVLLTGAAEPVEEARSRALGIDGVLSKPFEPQVATALVRRLLAEAPTPPNFQSANTGTAAAPSPAVAATADIGGSANENAIAVDDYFRRLDEALATAGLSTAPESAADLAAIAPPFGSGAGRSKDPETLIVARPALARADAEVDSASAESASSGPKLVDAFSALLDAEEGTGTSFVAGPVDMVGAPDPVPPPAVQWTSAPRAVSRAASPAPTADAAPGEPAPVEAAAETVAFQAVAAEAIEAAGDAEIAGGAATGVIARPLQIVPPAATGPATVETADDDTIAAEAADPLSTPPAALRADAPGQSALDGIDLDVFADAVAQKILHRLTDARIDAIVSERVLEIAERLVREEIDRIKADAQ
jgi:CheY-like chemotaxis protein